MPINIAYLHIPVHKQTHQRRTCNGLTLYHIALHIENSHCISSEFPNKRNKYFQRKALFILLASFPQKIQRIVLKKFTIFYCLINQERHW